MMVRNQRALGERLKAHRERRGITLETIAQTTKIPAALFAGLERGDCSRWPGGIYARAYVRAYAEAIGVDAEEAVADFNLAANGAARAAPIGVARAVDGTLRLSIADEPPANPVRLMRRAAMAGADLVAAFTVAWIAYALYGTGIWTTLAIALGYHAIGRILADEPFVYWIVRRVATRASSFRGARSNPEKSTEVAVGDAASTAA